MTKSNTQNNNNNNNNNYYNNDNTATKIMKVVNESRDAPNVLYI
jgi:hypothetical protein